jgi:hypothetical protein
MWANSAILLFESDSSCPRPKSAHKILIRIFIYIIYKYSASNYKFPAHEHMELC